MKKKLFALLCALLLVVQLTPIPTAGATDKVYFLAVNDNLLPLSDATMPFWSDGYFYIPGSLFSSNSLTAKTLGVYSSYKSETQTFMLYARNALSFNLETGTTSDGQGNTYPESAVTRNGQIFVPAARVCNYFSLTYTAPRELLPYGYFTRVCSSGSAMTDSLFLDSARSAFTNRYNEYVKSSAPVTPDPTKPTVLPPPVEEVLPEGTQHLYLGILAEDIDLTTQLLTALDENGKSKAAFYFPSALLRSAGDLTRRMSATGHTIGLWADGSGGAKETLRQLEDGNRLLSRSTGAKTRLCVLEGATAETSAAVQAAGWRVLSPKINYGTRGLSGVSASNALLKRVSSYNGGVTVWLGGRVTAGSLRAFVSASRTTGDRFLPMTELVQ